MNMARRMSIGRIRAGISWRLSGAKEVIARWLFSIRVQTKWRYDRFSLPLCRQHYHLYRTLHEYYYKEMGCFPDLVKCRDYNEKIQWLKLFDQDERTVLCSDKLGVREHVKERAGEKYMVRLYQACNKYEEIDFDKLPDSFVIKANHDSGTVVLVREKSQLDHVKTQRRIDAALRRVYGREKGEWAYALIQPKVLVEEFIDPASEKPPADYKFHCVDGAVRVLQYIYDRGFDTKEQMIKPDGNPAGYIFDHRFAPGDTFRKPDCWDEMISVAEALAKGFKYVRVDMYLSAEGKIYAGEMTFWPMAGCYHGEGQKRIGSLLDFDRSTVKPSIFWQRAMGPSMVQRERY